jgi:hypothetical protein
MPLSMAVSRVKSLKVDPGENDEMVGSAISVAPSPVP